MAAAAAVTGCLTDVRKLAVSELPPAQDTVFSELIAAIDANPPTKLTVSKYASKQSSDTGSLASDPTKMFTSLSKATLAKINIQVSPCIVFTVCNCGIIKCKLISISM
jgi:hypothetical protein